jgi:hypothetical protein
VDERRRRGSSQGRKSYLGFQIRVQVVHLADVHDEIIEIRLAGVKHQFRCQSWVNGFTFLGGEFAESLRERVLGGLCVPKTLNPGVLMVKSTKDRV